MKSEKTYFEKLKDPRWQKKRLDIMKRADFACECCGNKERTLHIHHGYYTKGYEPWDYDDDTLYCICEYCHEAIEDTKHDIHLEISRIHPKYLSKLMPHILNFKDEIQSGKIIPEKIDWDEIIKT